MKQRVFFFIAALCIYCIYSCRTSVDGKLLVDFVVENQCSDTVVLKLYRKYITPDSVSYYSGLERLNPDPDANSNIIFDHNNGLIAIPSGDKLKYLEHHRMHRKKYNIDEDTQCQQSIEWIFTDSITIIFSDGTSLLHTLNGTTANNILKSKSYSRKESYSRTSDYAYIYSITEADHQAAKAASVR